MPLHTISLFIVLDCLENLLQDLYGGWHGIELPSAMVRHKDAIDAVFQGENGITISHDPLGEHWQARLPLDKVNDLPLDVVVLVVLDELRQG